jgi:ankyrin repeat protein
MENFEEPAKTKTWSEEGEQNTPVWNIILRKSPESGEATTVSDIAIDMGKAMSKQSKKSILHMMIEDEEEDQLLTILKQYREQLKFSNEETAENESSQRIRFINMDVNSQDINGWTPLITAIINRIKNIKEVTEILMDVGWDPFIMSNDGKNAFHWAARVGNLSVLTAIASACTSTQLSMLLNTPTSDKSRLKPLILSAKFDHAEAFAYLMKLEQKSRKTCIHNTYPEVDGHKAYSNFCEKCFTNNNIYTPDENGDTWLHHVVRQGSMNVYRFFLSVIIKNNKKCNELLGILDAEQEGTKAEIFRMDSSDLTDMEYKKGFWEEEGVKEYLMVDGSTWESDTESEEIIEDVKNEEKVEEKSTKDDNKEEEEDKTVEFTKEEAEVLRRAILKFFSHQNNKGNSILHEAVLEDRHNFIDSIKMLQLVKRNLKNKKGLDFEQLKNYLTINIFIRRYENAMNRINNTKKKKRWCHWFSEDEEEEEESIGIIKMQKIVSNEEKQKRERKAFMLFAYLLFFLVAWLFLYLIYSVITRKPRIRYPPRQKLNNWNN